MLVVWLAMQVMRSLFLTWSLMIVWLAGCDVLLKRVFSALEMELKDLVK